MVPGKNGGRTALLINTRFLADGHEANGDSAPPTSAGAFPNFLDLAAVRREMMEKLKAAKNGIRQRNDLRIELVRFQIVLLYATRLINNLSLETG